MIGHGVGLDFIGTSPGEIAERALALALVFLPHVSIALGDSSEGFVAVRTHGPRPSAYGRFSLVLCGCGALNVEIPTGSMGLGLRYNVIAHSNRSKTSGACLMGWKIEIQPIQPHLNPS